MCDRRLSHDIQNIVKSVAFCELRNYNMTNHLKVKSQTILHKKRYLVIKMLQL